MLMLGVNGAGQDDHLRQAGRRAQGRRQARAASPPPTRSAPPPSSSSQTWGDRIGVEVDPPGGGLRSRGGGVRRGEGGDARGRVDALIIDTAGRLHTKTNLMDELIKLKRVTERQLPGAPHESLMVLDAPTGQNGFAQARMFHEAIGLTGVCLTKLDGTAKGGIVVRIVRELERAGEAHRRRREDRGSPGVRSGAVRRRAGPGGMSATGRRAAIERERGTGAGGGRAREPATSMTDDERFMQRALELAARARASRRPIPWSAPCSCATARWSARDSIARAGEPHAEVEALRAAGAARARRDALRHPGAVRAPGADAALRARASSPPAFAACVVAMGDPNPRVAGRGRRGAARGGHRRRGRACSRRPRPRARTASFLTAMREGGRTSR